MIFQTEPDELLTERERSAVRSYVLKLAVIPASIATVIAFVLGFAINEVARGKAYTDSMQTFSKDINTATRGVEKSRAFAEFSAKELEKLRDLSAKQQEEIGATLAKVKQLQYGNATAL